MAGSLPDFFRSHFKLVVFFMKSSCSIMLLTVNYWCKALHLRYSRDTPLFLEKEKSPFAQYITIESWKLKMNQLI